MRELRRDERGFYHIVGAIVLVIVLLIGLVLVLPGALRSSVCGSTSEDLSKKWVEVLVDWTDPKIRGVLEAAGTGIDDFFETHAFLSDFAILVESNGRDEGIGRAYLGEMAGHYFVALGLYAGCRLTGYAAQGYEKELQDNGWKLGLLLGLSIVAPGAVSFLPSIQFILDLLLDNAQYTPSSSSFRLGPPLPSLEQAAFPAQIGGDLEAVQGGYFGGTLTR